jgi:DNA-binding CsgD family transcriptional regulator
VRSQLRHIADFLAHETNFRAGLKYVAVNVCPSGDPARLLLLRTTSAAGLAHLYNFGFRENLISLGQTHPFFIDQVLKHSQEGDRITGISHDKVYREAFQLATGQSDQEEFRMTIITPISSEFTLTISIRATTLDDEARVDFEILGSILNLYLSLVDQDLWSTNKTRQRRAVSPGQALTERQELILQLVREKRRNHEIAILLGYSESLIRQETMVIYKKLGISGRKSLISHPDHEKE